MDQSSVKPHIKGSYDIRENEPFYHFMFRPYHEHQIRYLQIHTNSY